MFAEPWLEPHWMLSTLRTPAICPMRAVDSPGLSNVTNARLAYLSGAMNCVQPLAPESRFQPAGALNCTFAFCITASSPVLPPEEELDDEDPDFLQQPVTTDAIARTPHTATTDLSFIREFLPTTEMADAAR